jgi:gamma-glutamyl:cysteine ligase YbdK (ATP-grasp superfamily)
MRYTTRTLTALVAIAATAVVTAAQGRGRPAAPPPPDRRASARAPERLTAEQQEALRALMRTQAEERRALQERHQEALARIAPNAVRQGSGVRRPPAPRPVDRGRAMQDHRRGMDPRGVRPGAAQQRGPAMLPPGHGRGRGPAMVPPGHARGPAMVPPGHARHHGPAALPPQRRGRDR